LVFGKNDIGKNGRDNNGTIGKVGKTGTCSILVLGVVVESLE